MAITWNNTPVVDSIQLPGLSEKYWVKDTEARQKIEDLVSATHFLGVTTTALTDQSTTNPIVINGEDVTAVSGDITIYKGGTTPLEFIFDGAYWQLLGGQAIEGAGALAYKDTAEGSYTPAGSITLSTTQEWAGDIKVVTSVKVGSLEVDLWSRDEGSGGVYFLTDISASGIEVVSDIYTSTVTTGSEIDAGSLPTLTNVTVNELTANISGTTLVIGSTNASVNYTFNSGSFPTYSFETVDSITSIHHESVASTNITGSGSYMTVELTGSLGVTYSGVTGTFAGSSATITVS